MRAKYNYSAITDICDFVNNRMLYVSMMVRITVNFALKSLKHSKKISVGLINVKSFP